MAINQVLLEGRLLGDLRATVDKGHPARFELLDDEGHVFRCEMWPGNPCGCRPGDRVLVIGHLDREDGQFLIGVVSLRKLAREFGGPIDHKAHKRSSPSLGGGLTRGAVLQTER
jgi:hypothetical protein